MEEVVIESQLLLFNESQLLVELRMMNSNMTELKAIMWSTFVHFNLLQQRRVPHSNEIMKLFQAVVTPIEETVFENRVLSFKEMPV